MNNPDPNYSEERGFVETIWRKGRGEVERSTIPLHIKDRTQHDPMKRMKKKGKKIK